MSESGIVITGRASNPLDQRSEPMAEIDLGGAALSRRTLEIIETMIRPLGQLVTHVDITLRRVSVQHLNEAYHDHQKTMAERYHERARLIVKDKNGDMQTGSDWYPTAEMNVYLEFEDDTTRKERESNG